MKKGMVFMTIVVFAVTLAMPAFGAEAPPSGTTGPAQQMPSPNTPMQMPDFKVEKVFIAKADAPNVPFTGPFYTNGNYSLACEISYAGIKSTVPYCNGPGELAVAAFKVDGFFLLDLPACLGPGEPRTLSSGAYQSAAFKAQAYSAGSHTYECVITQTKPSDSNSGNNTKSMTYQVLKPHKEEQPKKPKPY